MPSLLQILLALALIAAPFGASAERVREFEATVHVQPDGALRVEETIRYDFEGAWRSGVIRDLSNSSLRTPPTLVGVDVESVTDEVGRPLPFQVEELPAFTRLRIGEPTARVSGQVTVVIHYLVAGALALDGESAHLVWSATGDQWVVPIDSTRLAVHVPSLASSDVETECDAPALGEEPGCGASIAEGMFVFQRAASLPNGDELAVSMRFPARIIQPPDRSTVLLNSLREHLQWWMLSPLLTLLGLSIRVRRAGGRESRRTPSIQIGPPKHMRPAQAGVVWDGRMDADDVVATLVHLANRGHIEVLETQVGAHQRLSRTQFEISRTATPPDELAPYEELLMESLFELSNVVLASDLRHRFYTELVQLERGVFASMTPKVFSEHPAHVRGRYRTSGALLALMGVFCLALPLNSTLRLQLALALATAGGLIALCASFMPARTGRGARLRRHLEGFREYLDGHGELPDPGRFQHLLPFAIALGCADVWFSRHSVAEIDLPWFILASKDDGTSERVAAAMGRFARELSVSIRTRPTDTGAPTGGFTGSPIGANLRGGRW